VPYSGIRLIMKPPPERLETDRLVLRRSSTTDAAAVFERWAQDPEVTRSLVWCPHNSIEDTHAFLSRCKTAWVQGEEFVWMMEEKTTGGIVGSLAARPGAHGVSLGYLMARDSWGQGLMTEAVISVAAWWLAQKDIHRVWATCDVENQGSARVLEKAGFFLEGTLLRWEHHPNIGDEPRDALCYSWVRE